jgi:hypothetical protein
MDTLLAFCVAIVPRPPMSAAVSTTVPVNPFTDVTASVLSIFCHTEPLKMIQSPTTQSAMPLMFVLPATDTT